MKLSSIEICAGAGGQALGLEQAGFEHVALVEIEDTACETLRKNRPGWNVIEGDVHAFSACGYAGSIDLLAGGVPCPPFSVAGRQLGADDERDLFPEALRLVGECCPRAVLLENVKGIFAPKFDSYRKGVTDRLEAMGYKWWWRLVQSSDYGVSQLRPRAVLVAVKEPWASRFSWPQPAETPPATVGELLREEMASCGWSGAEAWAAGADDIAPTLVGGSKKHGGPDLGPTRSKVAWRAMNVDGTGVANEPPAAGFEGAPRLTVRMAAMVQGFPRDWEFCGCKTAAYRQVGNAFPPPVARAVGQAIREALDE